LLGVHKVSIGIPVIEGKPNQTKNEYRQPHANKGEVKVARMQWHYLKRLRQIFPFHNKQLSRQREVKRRPGESRDPVSEHHSGHRLSPV
jgi:hypothetical protein